jgi:hypothetical protein
MFGVDQSRECLAEAEAEAHRLGGNMRWRNSVRCVAILVRGRANVFCIQRRHGRSNGLYEGAEQSRLCTGLFVKSMIWAHQGDVRRARRQIGIVAECRAQATQISLYGNCFDLLFSKADT